jgi:hypothetical protein
LAGLSKQQQMQLAELLSIVANHQGLISVIHPMTPLAGTQ